MREIVPPPDDCDSLGKLTEWLEICGMPQRDRAPSTDSGDLVEDLIAQGMTHTEAIAIVAQWPVLPPEAIEHQQWGFGFAFDPGDRDMANEGYRKIIKRVAGTAYALFSYADGKAVSWRVRPELSEDFETVTTMLDGSPVNWEDDCYNGGGVPTDQLITTFTGRRVGKVFARLMLYPESMAPTR